MTERGSGRIVNVASSTMRKPPGAGFVPCIASKGAVVGFTRTPAVRPDDMAGAVAFLASDDAAMITGQTLRTSPSEAPGPPWAAPGPLLGRSWGGFRGWRQAASGVTGLPGRAVLRRRNVTWVWLVRSERRAPGISGPRSHLHPRAFQADVAPGAPPDRGRWSIAVVL